MLDLSVTVQPPGPTARGLSLTRTRKRWGEAFIKVVLVLCAGISVLTTVGIVLALTGPTVEFFQDVNPGSFFTGTDWAPLFSSPRFGVLPIVTATLVVTAVALLVAVPLGLGAAIYLNEYARPRTRKVIKPILELLAGIPTVVYGFFALTFVTPLLQRIWLGNEPPGIYNGLAAGLVMGIMILPIIASLSDEAIAAVPHSLRAGALALGSSRMQVAVRVVVPAALSGIVAAFVLGMSRAIGETMIVAMAAGSLPNFTLDPTQPMQTMTAFIAAVGLGDQPEGTIGYKTLFAVGSTLFVATFIMNMISIRLVRRFREVYE